MVLDIETAPDRHAQILARRQRGIPAGSPLNEVIAATVLSFREDEDGFGGFALRSWHRDIHLEADILMNVEAEMQTVAPGGLLVTFNGTGHDLPILRIRQMRWWLCGTDAISRLVDRTDGHLDLMLEMSLGGRGRWPSLADACAAVGFSLCGPSSIALETSIPAETCKCERDVIGTAILFMHVLSLKRASMRPLRQGLPALGCFLRETALTRPHLEKLALNRQLTRDAAWGAPH